MARVQDLWTFSLVSHRAQFLVLSSSFSTLYLSSPCWYNHNSWLGVKHQVTYLLHLSALWVKFILSPTSVLLMTQSYYSPVLLIRYTPLFWPCRGAFLTSRPGWRNTNWNWMTTRQMLSLWSSIEPFFLTLSPDLFVLALPTFRSRPALSTSVSLFQITLLTDTFQLSAVLLTWKSDTYVSSIRQYLTAETAKTLVCAFVLSK